MTCFINRFIEFMSRNTRNRHFTFPDILKSSEPMEAMRLGTTRGRMRHFSMFRKSLPG